MAASDDFPQLCETCLGPNPFVRMVKLKFGEKLCKISNLQYQGFRWKAGSGGRMKETIISLAVARERDICQTCLNDMKYGLPVGMRDKLLRQQEEEQQLALPKSDIGLRFKYGNDDGSGALALAHVPFGVEMANQPVARQLDIFARAKAEMEARGKTAFRNLPKLCSFWLAGSCTRVIKGSCPFRPCCGQFVFPEIAGDRERHGALVRLLQEKGAARAMKEIDAETRAAFKTNMGGNRDEAIRRRVTGEGDELSKKYMGKFKAQNPDLVPPGDTSVTTLWVGGLDEYMGEADIRDALYPHQGSLAPAALRVHLLRQAKCAFLEYPDRPTAEAVAASVGRSLVLQTAAGGKGCPFDWAKPKKADKPEAAAKGAMLPPPGMERAAVQAYSLEGLPAPVVEGGPRKKARTAGSVPATSSSSSSSSSTAGD